jgi:hypothetical protein
LSILLCHYFDWFYIQYVELRILLDISQLLYRPSTHTKRHKIVITMVQWG